MFSFLSYYIFETGYAISEVKECNKRIPVHECITFDCKALCGIGVSSFCFNMVTSCCEWRCQQWREKKKKKKEEIKYPSIIRGSQTLCMMVVDLFSNAFDNNAWLLLVIFLFWCCLVWWKTIFLHKVLWYLPMHDGECFFISKLLQRKKKLEDRKFIFPIHLCSRKKKLEINSLF